MSTEEIGYQGRTWVSRPHTDHEETFCLFKRIPTDEVLEMIHASEYFSGAGLTTKIGILLNPDSEYGVPIWGMYLDRVDGYLVAQRPAGMNDLDWEKIWKNYYDTCYPE